MDEHFVRKELSFLDTAVQETCAVEESQEIRLTDGLPDIGQVICGWGQPILRGKSWQEEAVTVSGGVMAWVLYLDENGKAQWVEGWIPFSAEVPLDRTESMGEIQAECLPGVVDVRQISPRKISARWAGWLKITCLSAKKQEIYQPEGPAQGVELLKVRYPLRLKTEAGEKAFLLEEELKLAGAGEVVHYGLEPKITDQKVLTDKLVFRGCGILHVLYETEKGLESKDFELAFSQFAQLEQEHGSEARGDICFGVTSLELEMSNGTFQVKAGLTAQYCISDMTLLELVEDGYSPGRELELSRESFRLKPELEQKRESITAVGKVAQPALSVADRQFLPGLPRKKGTNSGQNLVLPGVFQTLYYDEEGSLRSELTRWEDGLRLPCHENSTVELKWGPGSTEAEPEGAEIVLRAERPLQISVSAGQEFTMVTGYQLGEKRCQDPARPSLILRRAGDRSLWDMAKASGSTVEAIRQANDLQADPAPDQMLLIPVP